MEQGQVGEQGEGIFVISIDGSYVRLGRVHVSG
jgi:hypothetical protein